MNDTSEQRVQQVGYSAGSGRGAGAGFAAIEPSHIHVPRRRRVGPPAAVGTGETPAAAGRDEERRVAPTDRGADETRGAATALLRDAA
jgi:hypothetical protein